ncbi:amidohydrolase [Pantoea sp. 1.19]|uniref:amidohydrolase n=1 Tax=Pantoea sp. 1.19 TaxID=1925589 RepID=UPI00094890EB|nr:amidohydrolase [Pantoea sp. 1.19]
MKARLQPLQDTIDRLVPVLNDIYKDLHQHPELSMQEWRTAGIVANHLRGLGYEVTEKVGGTGVVGILRNGEGPTVMLRADMDALPMAEKTGLPWASQAEGVTLEGVKTPVAHMCGHDLHVAWMMGAAEALATHRDSWKGTLMLVFQPGEEVAAGALAMIDDMKDRFPKPDIILGQHVMIAEAGTVGWRAGPILTAGDSLQVTFKGRGAHGSEPQKSIDPVLMAAYSAVRLQSIVSRETAPQQAAVVTIGSIQAGTKENIIPDEARLKLNVRTYATPVRDRVMGSITRICQCESHASGAASPEISVIDSYPLTENDAAATAKLAASFHTWFGDRAYETAPAMNSEDFSQFGRHWQVPYVFWFVGCTEASRWREAVRQHRVDEIPANHASGFVITLDPTVKTGLEAMLVAALTWLH